MRLDDLKVGDVITLIDGGGKYEILDISSDGWIETTDLLSKTYSKVMIHVTALDLYRKSQRDSTFCWHQWKLYTGFTEKYNYCVRCGDKDPPQYKP